MRYHTFTVTVADDENYATLNVRASVKDALTENDLIVLEIDEGKELELVDV